jgi:DNA-binding response OmpR family regulator
MILVLEPDAVVRDVLVAALREQPDLAAHGVATADAALAALRGARVPVVLFDVPRAPADAAELARSLRAATSPWRGGLVGMTATEWTDAAEAVRALGVTVLDRPFADGEPHATIRRLLRRIGDRV